MSFERSVRFHAIALLLISVSVCFSAMAQVEIASGDLKGTIFDPSKVVVAGATVTATNVST